MKYFSPSYWFKLWVLSVPLFNDKAQGINAKTIDNKNIKNWVSNNTTDISLIENQQLNFTNNNQTDFINYQPYNLNQVTNQTIDPIYQTELEPIPYQHHKHRHEKSRNRFKRANQYEYGSEIADSTRKIKFYGYGDWYKGEIKFNPLSKKIKFEGNSDYFHRYFDGGTNIKYLEIDIWNQDASKVKNIWIGSRDWMTKIIEDYNLTNGIDYEEGYIIEIYTKEPWRTWFNIYKNNRWERFEWIDSASWDLRKKYRIRNNNLINYSPDNLLNDFPDVYSSKKISLGLINNNLDNDIKHSMKLKYPNLDIWPILILNKTDYSEFCQCFSAKAYISDVSDKYSFGNLKPTFTYITKTKLNELNTRIANDPKVKQWIDHINDWNANLPKVLEDAKTFTPELLFEWKRREKETIKSYIRDWSHVSTLIEHELKLDELNKNVQGLKTSFDSIKNQVNNLENKLNNLNERVTDLENTSNANCANIATISAGIISVIPVINTIGGAIATITAGSCAIAGV